MMCGAWGSQRRRRRDIKKGRSINIGFNRTPVCADYKQSSDRAVNGCGASNFQAAEGQSSLSGEKKNKKSQSRLLHSKMPTPPEDAHVLGNAGI